MEPARFVHSKEDAARVFTGFRWFYWGIEIVILAAAVVRGELVWLAIAWPIVLLGWESSVRRSKQPEWVLEITEDAVTRGETTVARPSAAFARFRRRRMRYAAWTELQVVGPAGRPVFSEGIRDDHRAGIAAALRERGWPVED